MQALLEKFEQHLSRIDQVKGELFPPASDHDLSVVEQNLEIQFPDDICTLYKWHNGQQGVFFLFNEFRIFSLNEIIRIHQANISSCEPDDFDVTDDSSVFKDCIVNCKWIPIGDNGGNTTMYLDMDPGKQGKVGQLLEACDGDPESNFGGIKEFINEVVRKIETKEIIWDENAGSFWPVDE